MTARQKSKLAMYQAVLSVCGRNRSVWRGLPAFVAAYEQFAGRVEVVEKLTRVQKRHSGGVAERKRELRESMCAAAHEISCAARACALSAQRLELAGRLDFSLSDLRMGRDALCLERCRQIHAGAREQLPDLGGFGVSEEKLAGFEQMIAQFCEILHKPYEIRAANKQITAQLPGEFKAADDLLNNHLDNLMPQFRRAQGRFFSEYAASRVMTGGSGHTPSIGPEETTID